MKRFKIGDKIVNDVDFSKVNTHNYDYQKHYLQFTSKPDESLETIGKVQTIIEIEDDMIITDFILSNSANHWFEKGSPYALDCKKFKK